MAQVVLHTKVKTLSIFLSININKLLKYFANSNNINVWTTIKYSIIYNAFCRCFGEKISN